jgi:hypothetical protein
VNVVPKVERDGHARVSITRLWALDAKFGDGKYLLESNEGLPQ